MKITANKQRALAAALCVSGVALALAFFGMTLLQPTEGVSLLLVGYKSWPPDNTRYAELRLVNKTRKTISYPLLMDYLPTNTPPVLSRTLTSTGWAGLQIESYCRGGALSVVHPLNPEGETTLLVPLRPEASTKRLAIWCEGVPEVKRSRLLDWLRRRAAPVSEPLGLEKTPLLLFPFGSQIIWCNKDIEVREPVEAPAQE